ncbi:hypothetical protein PAHAL_4G065800 [Panicum hallii]|uniref:Uncharacterized protein n=1 Tax=Panicum hallii TaxID=206008 RepID=A0A2T8JBZ3_9POAL|nr:hypothetical protein PAHAL_4G065800 [Panicum hallii]
MLATRLHGKDKTREPRGQRDSCNMLLILPLHQTSPNPGFLTRWQANQQGIQI